MVVRCTAKVLRLLGRPPSSLADLEPGEDDWYLNLLWLERRKCLLVTHAGSRFSAFAPDVRKRDLDPLGAWVAATVGAARGAERLPPGALGPLDPRDVTVAQTASRRVLGTMNDLALHIGFAVARSGGLAALDVDALHRQLQHTLHRHGGRYATPLELLEHRLTRGA